MTVFDMLARIPQNDDLADDDDFCQFGGDPAAFFDAPEPATATIVAFPTGAPLLVDDELPGATPEQAPISIRALGVAGKTYYYVVSRGGRIDGSLVELTPAQFSENTLLTLAPLDFWRDRFGEVNEKSGRVSISWADAKDHLIRIAQAAGFYNARKIRGRGTWLDHGRIVVNTGDTLVVDNETRGFNEQSDLDGFYSAGEPITIAANAEPLDAAGGQRIVDVLSRLNWTNKSSPNALAGWLGAAPICGGLPWRPHCWLVGPKGSGKSTVEASIVNRVMRQAGAVRVSGGSTEAGIRQMIGSDALPVLFDEAEGTDRNAVQRILKVLELARGAASADSAATAKGTADGGGHAFQLKSMFFFASINTTLKDDADKSRVAILELAPRPHGATPGEKAAIQQRWRELRADIADTFTDETAVALAARARAMAGAILKSADLFRDDMAAALGDGRAGDVWGTLAAARWHLTSDEVVPDAATARRFLAEIGFIDTAEAISGGDETLCLDLIYSMPIDVSWIGEIEQGGETRKIPRKERFAAGRLLKVLAGVDVEPALRAAAWRALADAGLRVGKNTDNGIAVIGRLDGADAFRHAVVADKAVLLVAPRHPTLAAHFQGNENAAMALNYSTMLARIGGRHAGATVRFGAHVAQPVWVPLDLMG
jgi:putative DNA primase/helicase